MKENDYIALAIKGDPLGLAWVDRRVEEIRSGKTAIDRYQEEQAAVQDRARREVVPNFDAHPENREAKQEFYARLRSEGAL